MQAFSLRHKINAAAGVMLFVSLLFGCKKMSHNGDLDGMWQVMEVAYADSIVEVPEGSRFYYNFYLHTFQLTTEDDRPVGLVGNMTYEAAKDRIYLDLPLIKEGRVSPKWLSKLVYWGMPQSGEMDAQIRQLNSSRLVMQYDSVIIVCRKF